MKIIITSGPMEMKIDDVRKIENSSTGKLGTLFANALMENKQTEVVYIHTENAIVPTSEQIKKILIHNPTELLEVLQSEIEDNCVVIHLMAISDFYFKGAISKELLFEEILKNKDKIKDTGDLQNIVDKISTIENKLSSKDEQFLYLSKEIKVIDQIKKINNKVVLVGFKLLSGVTDEELLDYATNIKVRANCDVVVANKKENITKDKHEAFIITNEEVIKKSNKQEIVNEVLRKVNITKE